MTVPRWTTRQLSATGVGEDRLSVWLDDSELVIALADGAGGIPGGARAAELAVAGMMRSQGSPIAVLRELDTHVAEDPLAGECTAVLIRARDGLVEGASCGDSAAILDGADLTRGQRRRTRVGGGSAQPHGFVGEGRRLLVCSDGISAYLRGEALAEALATPHLERAADALVAAVRLPSGGFMDDIGLVLVDLRAGPSSC